MRFFNIGGKFSQKFSYIFIQKKNILLEMIFLENEKITHNFNSVVTREPVPIC